MGMNPIMTLRYEGIPVQLSGLLELIERFIKTMTTVLYVHLFHICFVNS